MYYTLHEADVSKFAEIADARIREHFAETNLKRIRTAYGCSQAELAKKSGVGLRSIQLYEQRQKDINKASAESLYKNFQSAWLRDGGLAGKIKTRTFIRWARMKVRIFVRAR